jgi:predicted permease
VRILRAVGRRLVPIAWRETVERDLAHEASRHALAGLRADIWIALHAAHIGAAFRWRGLRGTVGRPRPGDVMTDLRYALRQWTRQPAFALAAISTLAIAIAANTTMFALTDAVLFRALPFADAGRLVWIASVRSDNASAPFTLPEFMDYRARSRSLAGLAAYANWSASLSGDGVTERFQGARMSANAFEVLGVSAAAGRLLGDADDRADAPRVAVISHRLWQQRFGGTTDVVGRRVRINGDPAAIVGVLPAHFPLPLRDIDVIVPLAPDRDPVRYARSSTNFLRLLGRLEPAVSADQAQQELTAICARLRQEFPVDYAAKQAVTATPLADAIVGDQRPTMVLLLGSVVVVLSTALANLLCLLLVRTNDRRAEMSVRMAMGASRSRLVRQLAVEALVLTGVAGTIGAGLAVLATSTATTWAPAAIPRLAEVRCDSRALLFASTLTLTASALFTLAPLGTLLRTRAHDALRLVSRGSIGERWNHRLRDSLVAAEIAAALVLLVGTTLLVREFVHLQRVQPGFTPDSVFQARVSLPVSYRAPADVERFHDALMARLAQLPGIQDVGLISAAPLSGVLATVPFAVVGQDRGNEPSRLPSANFRVITPGYLAAAGTRLVKGRGFSDRDRASTSPVAIVSEALADRWLGAEPIGRRVLIDDNNTGPRPVEVVGIVENVRQASMSGPAGLDLYIPLSQIHPDGVTFIRNNQFWMVRSHGDPEAFQTSFVTALRAVDRDAAVSGMGTMRQGLETWFAPRRFSLAMFAAFSVTAVLLAVSGLYGLVSYAVSQRRREIGLRMALGASIVDVRRLILGDATRLAIIGIIVGIGLVFAARPLKSWLVGDAAIEPVLASATVAALFTVVILAAAVPAYRASRIEPTVALKGD